MTDQGPIDLPAEEQAVVKFKAADGGLHDTFAQAQRASAVYMLARELGYLDHGQGMLGASDVAEWMLEESDFVRRVLAAVDRIAPRG